MTRGNQSRDADQRGLPIVYARHTMHRRSCSRLVTATAFALLLAACDEQKPGSTASVEVAATKPSAPPAPPPSASTVVEAPKLRKRHEGPCPKVTTLTFDEPQLETEVRRVLQKPEGGIAPAELKKIRTLNLSQATHFDELDPCLFPQLSSIKGLYLPPGQLDDLSPLAGLTSLESLRISATQVKDLTPLAKLTKLDRLDVGRTPVRDLAPLSALVNLTELEIDGTDVSDLSPLAKLDKLESLLMKNTRVADLTPLKGLKRLKKLYIEGSPVADTTVLAGAAGLKIFSGS